MKTCSVILGLLLLLSSLSGCSVNITTDKFIYQDDKVEDNLDLVTINEKITHDAELTNVSEIALTTSDGVTLKGVKLLHENARINIVFFGGSGMKISQSSGILNKFTLLPANVIWFDYRGVGVSERKAALKIPDIQQDALAIVDMATKHLPENIPTALHGISMGSVIATYVGSVRDIDALVLDGAISTVPALVDNVVPSWTKIFSTVTVAPELAAIDNIALIKDYHNPLLFLAGTNDDITPVAFSKNLYEAAASEEKTLVIIPEGKHGRSMKKEEAIEAYHLFIKQLTCCEAG